MQPSITHHQLAGHENEDAAGDRGLNVNGVALHRHVGEGHGGQLLNDSLLALELVALECEQAAVLVEAGQTRAVGGEKPIEVVQKRLKVCRAASAESSSAAQIVKRSRAFTGRARP